jgi:hypothetical protein
MPCTARRSLTKTASVVCSNRLARVCRGFRSCGWRRVSEVGARIGSSRRLAWRSRWSIAPPSPRPRRFWRCGLGNGSRRGTRWILASCPRAPRAWRDCRAVWWQSEHSHGSRTTGVWPKTTRGCVREDVFHGRSLHPCGYVTRLIVRRLARA